MTRDQNQNLFYDEIERVSQRVEAKYRPYDVDAKIENVRKELRDLSNDIALCIHVSDTDDGGVNYLFDAAEQRVIDATNALYEARKLFQHAIRTDFTGQRRELRTAFKANAKQGVKA